MSEANPAGRGLPAFASKAIARLEETGLSRREARKLYNRRMREFEAALESAAERKRWPIVPPCQAKKTSKTSPAFGKALVLAVETVEFAR